MKTLFSAFCLPLLLLLLLLVLATGPVGAARAPHPAPPASVVPTPDEQLFAKLIGEVGTFIEHKDMKALGALMAPDYTHYNPGGGTGHKTDELAYLATWPPTSVKLIGPVQVSRAGDMAVTVSRSLYSSTENGQTMNRTIEHMIAWTLHAGKWQMAIIQSKEVPA